MVAAAALASTCRLLKRFISLALVPARLPCMSATLLHCDDFAKPRAELGSAVEGENVPIRDLSICRKLCPGTYLLDYLIDSVSSGGRRAMPSVFCSLITTTRLASPCSRALDCR